MPLPKPKLPTKSNNNGYESYNTRPKKGRRCHLAQTEEFHDIVVPEGLNTTPDFDKFLRDKREREEREKKAKEKMSVLFRRMEREPENEEAFREWWVQVVYMGPHERGF